MKNISALLKLIRFNNLLFVALTQYLIQYAVITPILNSAGFQPTLSNINFFLLVLSTVLVAAAGYMINDYFDLKIDSFNKPKRITIGKYFKPHGVILAHQIINGVAVILGFYVAWQAGNFKLGFIHPITAGLLWFYSTGYKKQPLIGNVVVSFLTALVVLLVVLFENQLFHASDLGMMEAAKTIFIVTFFYFLFAFLISMIREVVKDMEDVKGDESNGCRTLPIVLGINKTKWIVYGILLMLMSGVAYIQYIQVSGGDFISTFYLFITLQIPLLAVFYFLIKAQQQKEFSFISSLVKVIMLMGILTMAYFYLLMHTTANSGIA